ncbi:MAG: hypothetical protein D6775_14410 [Caldilineae bacterium]|nr:MAG: hypothetical protein D6775_14410 [Caldilineae bacterium]
MGPGGRLDPAEWLWGVIPYTYLPGWLRWLGVGLATAVILWAGLRQGWTDNPRLRFPAGSRVKILIAALSLPCFYGARVVHTRWGDAYILVNAIAHPDVRLTYNWQAPLDTYLHARLFQLGERLWGWQDAFPAYWLLSSVAGAVAVWVLLRLAHDIGRSDAERWLILGLMATLGAVQLFFGYPENYTLISVFILAYLWSAWQTARGRHSLWIPSILLALALGFHPSTLVLQPSLWALAFFTLPRPARFADLLRRLSALLLPPLLVILLVVVLMSAGGHGLDSFLGAEAPGGGDHRWLVPLTQVSSDWEYYTLFSRGHLMDFINQHLLVMPFSLFLLSLVVMFRRRHLPSDAYSKTLVVAAAGYLLLTWLWNPDYGGQRDWDLFAPAAWPVTLLAAYWLTRALPSVRLAPLTITVVAAQFLPTAAWVYSNTRPWEWK